jgi:hypothetical protein
MDELLNCPSCASDKIAKCSTTDEEPAKPTERPQIDPLPRVAQLEDVRDKLNELIKALNAMASRLDALENSLGLIRGVIMKMGDATARRLEAVERRK